MPRFFYMRVSIFVWSSCLGSKHLYSLSTPKYFWYNYCHARNFLVINLFSEQDKIILQKKAWQWTPLYITNFIVPLLSASVELDITLWGIKLFHSHYRPVIVISLLAPYLKPRMTCAHTSHIVHIEIRGQFAGLVVLSFHHRDPRDRAQVISVCKEHSSLLLL